MPAAPVNARSFRPLVIAVAILVSAVLAGPASAIVPPEPAEPDGPRASYLIGIDGPSVYQRLVQLGHAESLAQGQKPDAVLVQGLLAEVDASQVSTVRAAERQGLRVISRYRSAANGLLVHATASQIERMAQADSVTFVEPAPIVRPMLEASGPHVGARQLQASLGYDGSGATVAVIDTGVDYTHGHLGGPGTVEAWQAARSAGMTEVITDTFEGELLFPNSKVVGGYDFVGDRYNTPEFCTDADMANGDCTNIPEPDDDPLDGGSHGTHVSGIVAGKAVAGLADGIAPGASLVGLKLYGRGGADEAADVLVDSIEWCAGVNLGTETRGVMPERVDALNISQGEVRAQGSRLFDSAVEAAVGSGIIVVSSAGNSGDQPFVLGAPSASPKIISVASTVPPSQVLNLALDWEGGSEVHPALDSSIGSVMGRDPVVAEMAWYGLACDDSDPPVQEINERIALVERGSCTFSEKVLNAQGHGAIAVVVFTDNRAWTRMPGNADGIEIPAIMIQRPPGLDIQEKLLEGTAITGTIDPASLHWDPSTADAISGFSSRGPSKNGALKPDIAAPGSGIMSALAGSGDGGAAFSGTSMSGPMVAGTAAVIHQRNRAEDLELGADALGAMLMNYSRPVIYGGGGATVSVVRQGAGLVDLRQAGSAKFVAQAGHTASLDLNLFNGMSPVIGDTFYELPIQLRSLSDDELQLEARSRFNDLSDGNQGVFIELPEAPILLPAGGTVELRVGLEIDGEALRAWDQRPELAGFDTASLQTLEIDGFIELVAVDDSGAAVAEVPAASVPFYVLPRRASKIISPGLPQATDANGDVLELENVADYDGQAQVFALPDHVPDAGDLQSGATRGSEDADEVEVLHELDLRAAGLRFREVEQASEDGDTTSETYLEFGILRHATAATPRVTQLRVFLDTDLDGRIDWRLRQGPSGGRMRSFVAAWDAEAGTIVESSEVLSDTLHATDIHTRITTMGVALERIGLSEAGPVSFYVEAHGLNEDWLALDAVDWLPAPTMDVAPDGAGPDGGPRFVYDPGMAARLPESWDLDLEGQQALELNLLRGPGETDYGLLLLYPDNVDGGALGQGQILIPGDYMPRLDRIYLPLLHNGEPED